MDKQNDAAEQDLCACGAKEDPSARFQAQPSLFARGLKIPIRLYQLLLSPLLPAGACRFQPSCSHYALEALNRHGAFKGSLLAGWRLLRCNPWGGTGYDPVPNTFKAGFFKREPHFEAPVSEPLKSDLSSCTEKQNTKP